jgi:PAS domain S-box-containing protein
MLVLDDDAVYTDVNDALLRSLGRPREEVVGQKLGFLSASTDQDLVRALWSRLMAEKRLVVGWQVPQSDGSTIGIEIVATADVPEPGRHLSVCLPPSRPSLEGRLSPRELQVTGLLARGLSGEQIAERLFLSPETVRTHIRNAMERMHAHTRAQLVALALDGDLISLGDRHGMAPAG